MSISKSFLKIAFFALFLLTAVSEGYAQKSKNSFVAYSVFVSNTLDITWDLPEGFTDLRSSTVWGPQEGNSEKIYDAMLRSKDEHCIILYPGVRPMFYHLQLSGEAASPFYQLREELAAASGETGLTEAELNSRIMAIDSGVIKDSLNADAIYMAELPLVKAYKGKYPYCISIYTYKKGQPSMFFKCFLTETGKKMENDYLSRLFKALKYRNDEWAYNEDTYLEESYKLFLRVRE